MKDLSRAGGFSALYLALAYVAAMPFYLLVVDVEGVVDPLEKVALLVAHQGGLYAVELVVYVLFGIVLTVLAVALRDRLEPEGGALMKVATPVALIWAGLLIASGMVFNVAIAPVAALYGKDPSQAATIWTAVDMVSSGLSGNGEIVGGTWMLLVSIAALRSRGLPSALNILGLVVAAVGILSVVPVLDFLGYVFGVGQIAWFAWLGIAMLQGKRQSA
jgi:hypothetical protein